MICFSISIQGAGWGGQITKSLLSPYKQALKLIFFIISSSSHLHQESLHMDNFSSDG